MGINIPGRASPRYTISSSGRETENLRKLIRKARRGGYLAQLRTLLTEMRRQLESNPMRWGEQMFWYHSLDLRVFHRREAFLDVWYCVDTLRRIVYIKSIRWID